MSDCLLKFVWMSAEFLSIEFIFTDDEFQSQSFTIHLSGSNTLGIQSVFLSQLKVIC